MSVEEKKIIVNTVTGKTESAGAEQVKSDRLDCVENGMLGDQCIGPGTENSSFKIN